MLSPLWVTLLIAVLATLLLISGRVRADIVGLLVALALVYSGVLPLRQALGGFSSDVVFVLIAIFILTKGLETSGVTAWLAEHLAALAGETEGRLVVMVMLAAAVLSLFMNTVAAAAVLLPPVLAVSRRREVAPSRVLIPMAYGTLLGGTATLLTTANLVTSASLAAHGYRGYGLLDFLPVGLSVTLAGLLYMVFVGRRLLPRYRDDNSRGDLSFTDLLDAYGLREGLHALEVRPQSPLREQLARQPAALQAHDLTLVGLLSPRGLLFVHQIDPQRRLRAGDVLLLAGNMSPAKQQILGLKPQSRADICQAFREQATLAEIVLNPRGEAVGRSPEELRLFARYGLRVLAIWRGGHIVGSRLPDQPLQEGDALLVQIPPEAVPRLRRNSDFIVLETFGSLSEGGRWARVGAVLLLLLALVPAALGWVPLVLSTLSAATLMMLSGIVPPEQAYEAVSWRAIFLIAGMIPLGVAMRQTGAAAFLSRQMLQPLAHAPAWAIAAAFLLLTALLAQITSGQVAALILAPLAIAAAEHFGLNPRGLGMAVAVGASFAFLLPTGHPVNLLVMGPGEYRPKDYFKVGLPLLLVVAPVAVAALQVFWLTP